VIILRIFPKGERKIANYKWQLHRAGLLNFWYYDEEEFQFAAGKLLLRGNNGSGKSVTMQSFIPVLLDGRKSPDRLDPFGSKARRMEDYLLGEKGIVDREERTGYLYLEYKKEGLEQYLTTGIGLRAKRAGAMDFWGFVILDNRRIGKDFLLYKKERSLGKEEKVPLTRVELENRLADGGRVVRTSKEYMNLVNRHIFGFENITDFEELKVLEEIQADLVNSLDKLEKRQKLLDRELGDFPAVDDVKFAYDSWQRLIFEGKIFKEDVDRKNTKVKNLLALLNTRQSKLRDLTKDMALPIRVETYGAAVEHMRHYQENLHELELKYKDHLNSVSNLKNLKVNLQDAVDRVDELKGEINVISDEIKKLELQINSVKERLNLSGAEEVKKRINEVAKRISQFPQDLSNTENQLTTHLNSIKTIEHDLAQLKLKQRIYGELRKHWEEILKTELKLGLVKEAAQLNNSIDFIKLVREIKEVLKVKENMTRERLTDRLNQVFYQEQSTLIEYRLTQQPVDGIKVELDLAGLDKDSQVIEFLVDDLVAKSCRTQILLEYSGNKVSPFFVLEKIEGDIGLQQAILNDKDRELYEEIIMNSVGRIIRARINRAEAWVAKIDQLMSERDTSSGLTFSLKWRPLTAQWEEELDTKELVDLLRLDPKFLKPSDMDKITQHFRSKVSRAKELMAEKGYGETFNQIIREMLDYRQWFQFTLYYQRTREKKKELTNKVFYTFSGGEKAMAMYIPLFSAAYSRYQEARKEAPYIISLDEAFAGVDENNIRDMFDLVEKLGFNFIMNSQSLWGDYDTVSALSICELVRPQNAPYVTVIRYWWNGREKELVVPENFSVELKETADGV
jgi:seryl-tRNA synthetase